MDTQQIPDWAQRPFHDSRAFQAKVSDLLHLTREAISFLRARPAMNHVLNTFATITEKPVSELDMCLAAKNAELAEAEEKTDFPLVHAQATILLWTGLEALVRDFLATWLENVESARLIEPLRRTRVRLGELEALSGHEKYLFILDSLEDTLGSRRFGGAERFEALFRAVGMSSAIPDAASTTLFELSHVRHILVHGRGIVDRKFIELLPQLGLTIGTQVTISHDKYHRYFDAVDIYVFELLQRLREHFGLPRVSHRPDCRLYVESHQDETS